jgi:hypothetical protein
MDNKRTEDILKELKIEPILAKISKCKSTGFNMLMEFKETEFHY